MFYIEGESEIVLCVTIIISLFDLYVMIVDKF